MTKTKRCSKFGCKNPRRPGQRYCREHHAEYMRMHRRKAKQKREAVEAENARLRAEINELKSSRGAEANANAA